MKILTTLQVKLSDCRGELSQFFFTRLHGASFVSLINCVSSFIFFLASYGLVQRFVKFNGGFSKEQLDWLERVLIQADEAHERVTVLSKSHQGFFFTVTCE